MSAALRAEADKGHRANRQLMALHNSASWKVTKPIRAAGRARRPEAKSGGSGPGVEASSQASEVALSFPQTAPEELVALTSWTRLFDPDWYIARYPDV